MPRPSELLYVHPGGHLNDYVVPMGALSCMNAVDVPKHGRFASELRDDEVRRARVIALDLHWAVGLPGFSQLARHLRARNPSATLVAGGISAGLWGARLLDELPLDYVLVGDAERSFAALIEGVLSGREPGSIPNVVSRDVRSPERVRMTDDDFDSTDSLTSHWFPGYERAMSLEAEAFSHAPSVSVTRGCSMRCATCYGSFAESFGPGHLRRSAASVVRAVATAREAGAPRLRLVLGKPSPARLGELCRALASSGPHRFPSEVGLFCCTPPAREDAEALEAAFPQAVMLSTTHPAEHQPELSAEQVSAEWDAWSELGKRRGRLGLEVWCRDQELLAGARREARAAWAGAWELTRPTDASNPGDYERVSEATEPLWSLLAMRLLSPALSELLRPYAWLDDLDADPTDAPERAAALAPAARELAARWKLHRLPALPSLAFGLVTVPGAGVEGGLARVDPARLHVPIWLERAHRHDAVELSARLELPAGRTALCFVASLEPELPFDATWLEALALPGLRAVELDAGPCGATVRVRMANGAARVTVTADDGRTLASTRFRSGLYRGGED